MGTTRKRTRITMVGVSGGSAAVKIGEDDASAVEIGEDDASAVGGGGDIKNLTINLGSRQV